MSSGAPELFLPPMRLTVFSNTSEPSSHSIKKTLVYFFLITVLAARCYLLAPLDDFLWPLLRRITRLLGL